MACPICEKRKGKRYCPAKAEYICTICCGTEREVTIDCPWDCPYLIEAHKHEFERKEIDWSKVPFADVRMSSESLRDKAPLMLALGHAVHIYARDHKLLADPDAIASLQSLAETYQTLAKGIYYENPPEYAIQRGLYDALKASIEDLKNAESQRAGVSSVRDSEIRDALILSAQLAATRTNGRPRSRAYLDFLRSQFKSDEEQKSVADTLILP